MERDTRQIVEEVVKQLMESNSTASEIPIGVSARHCHLTRKDLDTLFGPGYELTKKVDLSQPGQFAANETVTIAGPKGSISKVRILGPLRKASQVEISKTDTFTLGLKPPVRESGNISGSSPVTLVGPKGSVYLQEGLIIAQTHIHMTPKDADRFRVDNGDLVSVACKNAHRSIRFENVLIRTSPKYKLEMHIDTDEANAGLIETGDTGTLFKTGES